jgi:hypothetical protein
VFSASVSNKIQASAVALGVRLDVLEAGTDNEIEVAFAEVAQHSGEPIMLGPDPFYTSQRAQIVSFAARYAVPVMYIAREFTETGGLVSYGPDIANAYREAGTYTAVSSKARSRVICRSHCRPNLIWSSISRPRNRSVSLCANADAACSTPSG